jgi:uncharacterized protein
MIIGVLTLELFFPFSRSLKDKRHILHGFKVRVRTRYNAALAETGFQDKWQRAAVGIVTVNSHAGVVEETLNKILSDARDLEGSEIASSEIRYI